MLSLMRIIINKVGNYSVNITNRAYEKQVFLFGPRLTSPRVAKQVMQSRHGQKADVFRKSWLNTITKITC